MTASVVALDVGGTSIKAARYDRHGTCEARRSVPTPAAGIVDAIGSSARALLAPDTVSVGVVVPGLVDPVTGTVGYSVNLGWRDVALRAPLADRLPVPVAIDHDVTAATRAEAVHIGAGSVLFVSLGTGVAAGFAVDGVVWRGTGNQAGELGHVCVVPDGEACACGQRGCLEVYASGAGVARRYRAAGGATGRSAGDIAARSGNHIAARSGNHIAAGSAGDPIAVRVWDDAVTALAAALATAVLLFDPAVIVLGGGLSTAGSALIQPVRLELSRRLVWRSAPPVRAAHWGVDAGLRGAAMLAWRATDVAHAGVPA
jgi:glucokinase